MSQHPFESEQLTAYLDGALEPWEEGRIRLHLPSCHECRQVLASLRTVKAALARSRRYPMPEILRTQIAKKVSPPAWTKRLKNVFARPLVWAPAGVLAAAAVLFFMTPRAEPVSPTVPLEVLMASHARYQSEGLAPRADVYQAHFSAHIAEEIDRE